MTLRRPSHHARPIWVSYPARLHGPYCGRARSPGTRRRRRTHPAGFAQSERFWREYPMKKIILAAAIAALASMSVAAFASAGVDRYQVATGLTVTATFDGTTLRPHLHPRHDLRRLVHRHRRNRVAPPQRDRQRNAQRPEHHHQRCVPGQLQPRLHLGLQRLAERRERIRFDGADGSAEVSAHDVQLQEPRGLRQLAGRRLGRGPLVHRDADSLRASTRQLFHGAAFGPPRLCVDGCPLVVLGAAA